MKWGKLSGASLAEKTCNDSDTLGFIVELKVVQHNYGKTRHYGVVTDDER